MLSVNSFKLFDNATLSSLECILSTSSDLQCTSMLYGHLVVPSQNEIMLIKKFWLSMYFFLHYSSHKKYSRFSTIILNQLFPHRKHLILEKDLRRLKPYWLINVESLARKHKPWQGNTSHKATGARVSLF